MFGVDSIELMIIAFAALLFIGPKDLPRVMVAIGRFVGKVRGHARHFTAGIDNMMREAELEEMEKKWREDNQRILSQYPSDAVFGEPGVPEASLPGGPVMTALPEAEVASMTVLPEEPLLPLEVPAAPDTDPLPPAERPLP